MIMINSFIGSIIAILAVTTKLFIVYILVGFSSLLMLIFLLILITPYLCTKLFKPALSFREEYEDFVNNKSYSEIITKKDFVVIGFLDPDNNYRIYIIKDKKVDQEIDETNVDQYREIVSELMISHQQFS